ncbi:uncharacterized protein TM35_000103160 [Trypanosoma theileri]|uniref:Mucin-associated surface protein (MASP) n=1 Tax=Trypanosoma theileri TaxID=67003 RepID=A0A1X0NZS5_9TRYP|nr:uncharacterized protein TM35_000103160 [Trypanosoma theileri]ORC90048.1 hypothetical protein TM35_000103160 [Trypanosoma theileri]
MLLRCLLCVSALLLSIASVCGTAEVVLHSTESSLDECTTSNVDRAACHPPSGVVTSERDQCVPTEDNLKCKTTTKDKKGKHQPSDELETEKVALKDEDRAQGLGRENRDLELTRQSLEGDHMDSRARVSSAAEDHTFNQLNTQHNDSQVGGQLSPTAAELSHRPNLDSAVVQVPGSKPKGAQNTGKDVTKDTSETLRTTEQNAKLTEEENEKQENMENKADQSTDVSSEEASDDLQRPNAQEQAKPPLVPQEAQRNDHNSQGNTANGGTNSTQEGTVQESSSSPETPEKPSLEESEGTKAAETTNAKNGSTPEGIESTGNTGDMVNTDTTTTTTLPPELTNNKKGDADSSSSISSSVWVRVPLLIVVTLACILVC